MKKLFLPSLILIGLTMGAGAQLPAVSTHPSSAWRPITASDVRVVPFCRDMLKVELAANQTKAFDELTVSVTQRIHFFGKKRADHAEAFGKPVYHLGKLALLSPANRSGKMIAKVPSIEDATYYLAVLELPDAQLDSEVINLAANQVYNWKAISKDGTTILSVTDQGGATVSSVGMPTDKVKGFGFASTVRYKGNEADLEISFD